MPITSAISNTFKQEILQAEHDFDNPGGNTFKIALYTNSATLNKSTTTYTGVADEVASGGGYTTGGESLTSVTPVLSGDSAVCDFSNVSWTTATFVARGCLIYNDSHSSKASCAAIDFGGDKSVTSGTFTIEFPSPVATTAIIEIA